MKKITPKKSSEVSDDELLSIMKKVSSAKKKEVEIVEPHSIKEDSSFDYIPIPPEEPFNSISNPKPAEEIYQSAKSIKKPRPITQKKQPKLSQSETAKLQKYAVDLIPKSLPREEHNEPTPEIEYVIRSSSKYDLNWYYAKEKFIGFKNWLFTPWRMYSNWWNKNFNTPKIKLEKPIEVESWKGKIPMKTTTDIGDLFEDNEEEYIDIEKLLHKNDKFILPEIQEDVSMEVIEVVFEEIKSELIKQVYANINAKRRKI